MSSDQNRHQGLLSFSEAESHPSNVNLSLASAYSQSRSTEMEHPSEFQLGQQYGQLDQQYGVAMESIDSNNSLGMFNTLPQRLLNDVTGNRTDGEDSSTDLMDALNNIASFEKG